MSERTELRVAVASESSAGGLKNALPTGCWPDDEAKLFLSHGAEAAGPGRRILVAGGVRPDDAPPRIEIDKLVTGDRDRPPREFRTMADAVGVDIAATHVGAIDCIVRDRQPTV